MNFETILTNTYSQHCLLWCYH